MYVCMRHEHMKNIYVVFLPAHWECFKTTGKKWKKKKKDKQTVKPRREACMNVFTYMNIQ